MKNYLPFAFSFAVAALLITSCSKDDDTEPPAEAATSLQQSSEDHNLLDNEFNTVFNTVDNIASEDTSIKSNSTVLPACASRTFDVATKTLTVDFGTTNCLCADGLNRRGKIIAVFDGKYRTAGTTVSVSLDQYFVEDVEFRGTKTIENLGNASGNFKYSYKVENAEAVTADGTISWETNATIERIQGDSTITPWDDIYEATGSSSGTSRRGTGFTVDIDPNNPLVKKISLNPLCWRNFVSGIITMEDDKGNTFQLDYDPTNDEMCDKEAQLRINGGTPFTILLR